MQLLTVTRHVHCHLQRDSMSTGPLVVIVGLMENDKIAVSVRAHILVLIPSFFIILDVNVLSRRKWGVPQQYSSTTYRTCTLCHTICMRKHGTDAVHPGSSANCGSRSTPCTTPAAAAAGAPDSSLYDPCKLDTSLRILRSAPLNAAFAKHVERALCYESYKFLTDATAYADTVYVSIGEQVMRYAHAVITCLQCCHTVALRHDATQELIQSGNNSPM
jgi:hypothetical protein